MDIQAHLKMCYKTIHSKLIHYLPKHLKFNKKLLQHSGVLMSNTRKRHRGGLFFFSKTI